MNVNIYNQKGGQVGQAELPSRIFDVKISPDLVHQVVVAQMANRRQGTAHTKDRSEVSGGGRKPWRQKGTGRARHGSIRSPIWRTGGVAFGPRKEKVYKRAIPKQMRRRAGLMVLAEKARNNFLVLLDKMEITRAKTKDIVEILNNLPCKEKSILLLLPKIDKNIILAARNIQKVATMQAKDLNALDLLSFQYVVMPKECLKVIEETFLN